MLPNPVSRVAASHPAPGAAGDVVLDPATEELKSFLVDATGNFRLSAKNSPVAEKARQRILLTGQPSLCAYLELLKQGDVGKEELDCLIAELTVGETYFFRHPDHFDALRDQVLPACLRRNKDSRQVRIWSAGCASGAESYSIAITAHTVLGDALKDWNVTIVGSDINRAFLAKAEAAAYSEWDLRGISKAILEQHFSKSGRIWTLNEKYKKNIRFVYHNIISDETPSMHNNIFGFDIVFCRNVMIYFNDSVNQWLVERINDVLVEDGWLFVGSTDFNSRLDAAFAAERHSGAIVYRKRPPVGVTAPPRRTADPLHQAHESGPLPEARATPRRRSANGAGGRARRATPDRKTSAAGRRSDIETIVDLANRGDWANAARHCQALLAVDAFNAWAHYYHALVLQSTAAPAEAERALRRAIYLDRGFALAHYQLGMAHKDGCDLEACAKAFRNTLDALSQTPDEMPVSPCGQITALELRELAARQLELLGGR